MITVGIDTYVTVEQADELAMQLFISTDESLKLWLELSESDKEVLLRNSTIAIDSLKFDGRRQHLGQKLEFPRTSEVVSGIGYRLFISQFYDNGLVSSSDGDGGLTAVKKAQVMNSVVAAEYSDLARTQIGVEIQGLTSKRAGPISETYGKKTPMSESASNGIYSPMVYRLLVDWLSESRMSY